MTKARKWRIGKLKEHPRQRELFTDLSEPELSALADDMAANGLRQSVEILSDGTIVAGHQRVRAAKRLGWKTIEVVIRQDLEKAGDDAIVRHLIQDNLNRRQLDKLALARCYLALKAAEPSRPADPFDPEPYVDVRDKIAERLNIGSGRNLDRYLRVLKTPQEVQDAFSREQLSLTLAGAVAGLAPAEQEVVAAEIRAGGCPEEVVKYRLPRRTRNARRPTTIYLDFIEDVAGAIELLGDRIDEIHVRAPASKARTAILEQAQQLLQSFLRLEKRVKR